MSYAQIQSGQPVEITVGTITSGDVQFSYETMLLWDPSELSALSIYDILEPPEPPAGKRVASTNLVFDGTSVTREAVLEDIPPPPVPQAITPNQGRLALYAAGLLPAVKGKIALADEPTQIWFEYATVWERSNPILLGMAQQLSLSSDQLDALFTQAAAIH